MGKIILILGYVLCFSKGWAQTCCSGGVPISNNLGLPTAETNSFQASLSYDLNVMNTLKDGVETLSDNTRRRTTHSVITQVGYTISKNIAFDILIPYVRQERALTPVGFPKNFEATNGIGDVVLLGKYQITEHIQAGLGIKFPTGSSTEQNSGGLTLPGDLQPGSGSWDLIYLISGAKNLGFRPSGTISGVVTFRNTGENPSYFNSFSYKFGNEFQATANYTDQLLIGSIILSPGLGFRYRSVIADQIDSQNVPSTGGQWVFIRPGLGIPFNPAFNLRMTADLPLYARLNGTQLTPTVRINLALYIKINVNNSQEP